MVSKKRLKELALFHTLVGKKIEIVDAKNKHLIGLKGVVCDETANLFVVKTLQGVKRVIKKQATFKVVLEGKTLKIDGELLHRSLIERIKRLK